ncbi:MAG: response regulator [Lachnospiraceae bacterium]|nr:response regulator [Lachnospiraceae bacterium]
MKKILIVDDERIERAGIRMLLGTMNYELEILEAANGKKAMEVLQEKKIDFLLTDIKMPFMTGLELAREARKKDPDIQIAIFSGFGEFSYAQEAMKYAVTDYILKPVNPVEFRNTMENMLRKSEEWEKDRQEKQNSSSFKRKYYLQRYLLTGNTEYLDAIRQVEERLPQKDRKPVQNMMLLEMEGHFFEDYGEQVVQGLERLMGRRLDYLDMNENRLLLFFYRSASDNYARIAGDINKYIRENFRKNCFVAVSRMLNGMEDAYRAYQEVELLMENKFFHTDTSVFLPENGMEENGSTDRISGYQKRMKEDIRLKDFAHLWSDYRTVVEMITREKADSQMYVKFLFSELVKDIYEEQGAGCSPKLIGSIEKIYRSGCMNDVCIYVEEAMREFETRNTKSESGLRNDIRRVQYYICTHLNENLSTDTLAGKVYLSPGYLSYIFKKETGMNLSRYIRECRMEKAKELLSGTSMKIVQICREVGFSNVSYFCQSFREYCGVSPEKYRKGETEDEEMD